MIRASILALMISGSSAFAGEPCGAFADKVAELAKEYGEAQSFVGFDQRGLIIVMTINRETKSWTALQVEPNGWACIVAAGTDGEFMDPPEPGDPA